MKLSHDWLKYAGQVFDRQRAADTRRILAAEYSDVNQDGKV
jgi:hypothetical protein